MLNCAEKLKDDVDTFVHKMVGAEKDQEKCQNFQDLQLTNTEWDHVSLLLGLLAKAEYAQQSFASNTGPATHLALPALKSLTRHGMHKAQKQNMLTFGLHSKQEPTRSHTTTYEKTADLDVYIIIMCMFL